MAALFCDMMQLKIEINSATDPLFKKEFLVFNSWEFLGYNTHTKEITKKRKKKRNSAGWGEGGELCKSFSPTTTSPRFGLIIDEAAINMEQTAAAAAAEAAAQSTQMNTDFPTVTSVWVSG